ncbi:MULTISPECIES: hypothetical protein [unclassified Pedobacter]|uniref:hypothetical protein n=1 Tax=unclassified Pedobacter TaxID=2628915 RepID=UPI00141FE02E|nr:MULTISPECIES: hypothetical protein [unclassified Pedobacter]NII85860.1 hypothetical protein [Pedobacter sp. SG908]NMN39225.1 hypothetical protein [Pedobacter sp. SG918]
MPTDFVTFQRFNDRAAALTLAEIFKENKIEVELEDASANFDVTFANNEIDKDYRIKLKPEDFERANILLRNEAEKDLVGIDPNYYIFDFSDDELKEVIEKQDEWSSLDFLLATKILKERGVDVNADQIQALKLKRIEALSQPEKSPKLLIVAGYITAIIGRLIAIIIGAYLRSHKKTLPNGERVFGYAASDRAHGERILIIGILVLILSAIYEFSKYA